MKNTYTVKASRNSEDVLDELFGSCEETLAVGLTLEEAKRIAVWAEKVEGYARAWCEEEAPSSRQRAQGVVVNGWLV